MTARKALIVEDDMILSMVNKKILESVGHTVVATARNGQEAIELAIRHQPDYVLMDVRLKGELDGISTMEEIGKHCTAPAIYISGNSDAETLARAQKTNMKAFLVKPVSAEMLRNYLV